MLEFSLWVHLTVKTKHGAKQRPSPASVTWAFKGVLYDSTSSRMWACTGRKRMIKDMELCTVPL